MERSPAISGVLEMEPQGRESNPSSIFTIHLENTKFPSEWWMTTALMTSFSKTIRVSRRPNIPPVMKGDDAFSVVQNEEISFSLKGASDVNRDKLSYSLVESIPSSQGELLDCLGGTPDLSCRFKPAKDFYGKVVFSYRAKDKKLYSNSSATVTITATKNNVPVAHITPITSGLRIGQIVSLDGSGSSDEDNSPLSYKWSLSSSPTKSRSVIGESTAVMSNFIPDRGGDYLVHLTVNDGQSDSPPTTLLVSVPENKAPTLTGVEDKTVTIGSSLGFTVSATDDDGDDVALFGVGIPEGSVFNTVTGIFRWRPLPSQVGVHEILFKAADGLSDISKTVSITVNAPPPDTPTGFRGRVIDGNSMAGGSVLPIQGVVVSISGFDTTATSDANGYFTLTGIPAGRQRAGFDSTGASGPDGVKYANFHGMINFTKNALNDTGREFMLPRIDTKGMATVETDEMTMVENPSIGVRVEIPANVTMNPDGTPFTGTLSLSRCAGVCDTGTASRGVFSLPCDHTSAGGTDLHHTGESDLSQCGQLSSGVSS